MLRFVTKTSGQVPIGMYEYAQSKLVIFSAMVQHTVSCQEILLQEFTS